MTVNLRDVYRRRQLAMLFIGQAMLAFMWIEGWVPR
jgi:hypothetical protein